MKILKYIANIFRDGNKKSCRTSNTDRSVNRKQSEAERCLEEFYRVSAQLVASAAGTETPEGGASPINRTSGTSSGDPEPGASPSDRASDASSGDTVSIVDRVREKAVRTALMRMTEAGRSRQRLEKQARIAERRAAEEQANGRQQDDEIRYSLASPEDRAQLSDEAESFFARYRKGAGEKQEPPTFVDYLMSYIIASGMSNVEVYKRANLSKSVFSATISNRKRIPKKSTVIALAIALRLDLKETERLMMKAGYTFSNAIVSDLVVVHFINKGNFDIDEINEVLYDLRQPLLGSK